MSYALKTGVRVLMAAGVFLASASLAGATPKMTENNSKQAADRGVSIQASSISGWAVVDEDGTLARKLNAKTVTHTGGTNDYIVSFNSNITNCAYTATIGLSGSSGVSAPGFVTVVGANSSVKAVYVSTYDVTGADTELPFHLEVSC